MKLSFAQASWGVLWDRCCHMAITGMHSAAWLQLMFDFQSPLLLPCANSAKFLSAVFLHLAQGQRGVSFLWQGSGGRVVKWLFLWAQQKSVAQVLMSYPLRCLFELLGGPFRLWSVGKAQDTSVRPWVNTVSCTEPVLHTKLSMKQNVQWFTSLKVMQTRLMTDARLFAQCYQPR